MSVAPQKTHITLEELLASPDAGRFEIVNGQLEEVHVSNLSVEVASLLFFLLRAFCENNRLGKVFGSDCYYQCFGIDATRARRPDVSFVAAERLPKDWLAQGFFRMPPDLAVEVVSQNDTAYEVAEKVNDYLGADVRLVWQVDPKNRTVLAHRRDGSVQKIMEDEILSGEDVVPGFQCRVADFLPKL